MVILPMMSGAEIKGILVHGGGRVGDATYRPTTCARTQFGPKHFHPMRLPVITSVANSGLDANSFITR